MDNLTEKEITRILNNLGWRFVDGVPYCKEHVQELVDKYSHVLVERWTSELVKIHLGCSDGFSNPECHYKNKCKKTILFCKENGYEYMSDMW